MERVKKVLKKNVKLVIGIIVGAIVSGTGVYAATTILSQSVYYNNSTSGATSTNVQDALDELYTKANTRINPNDFGIKRNTAKTIMATPGGLCIKRNGTVHCLTANNWDYEQNHIQQVFSDISCYVSSSRVECDASDFYCFVSSSGTVNCTDRSDDSFCYVNTADSLGCS